MSLQRTAGKRSPKRRFARSQAIGWASATAILLAILTPAALVGMVSSAAPASAAVSDTCGQPGSIACAEHSYGSPNAKLHLAVLGDSYAAGLGAQSSPTSNSYTSGPPCYQSEQSYAGQIALDSDGQIYSTLAACSGATISDVINTQIHDLNSSFDAVTISAGGNDIGFAKIATDCEELKKSACDADLLSANKTVKSASFVSHLETLYHDILTATPSKTKVYVMGYPYLFPRSASTSCSAEGPVFQYGPKLVDDANTLVYDLDSVEYTASLQAGLRTTFINPTNPTVRLSNAGDKRLAAYLNFDSHNVCGNPQWVHGIILAPPSDTLRSFHPNYRGNSAYAGLLALYMKEYQ